jgi:hypothetical protein
MLSLLLLSLWRMLVLVLLMMMSFVTVHSMQYERLMMERRRV